MNLLKKISDFLGSLIYGEIELKLEKILEEIEKDQARTQVLEDELKKSRLQLEEYKNLVLAIGDTIPDMMWAKDIDGKYIYVNTGILNGLFYGMSYRNIIGKTDIEIAEKCRKKVGAQNHTFGEVCGNSDLVVLENLEKGRFLEWGKINGKEIYLEVYKAPLYRGKEVIGTVGTGRDVTEWYTSIKNAVLDIAKCKNTCNIGMKDTILQELDKYKFEA